VVKKGDTLWDIAKAYLKDPFRWPEVFQRNTDVVENPALDLSR
jgi:nucleoid-associated protein YgaU